MHKATALPNALSHIIIKLLLYIKQQLIHSPQSTATMSKSRQSAKPMIFSSPIQDTKLESEASHASSVNQIGFRLLSLSNILLH